MSKLQQAMMSNKDGPPINTVHMEKTPENKIDIINTNTSLYDLLNVCSGTNSLQ